MSKTVIQVENLHTSFFTRSGEVKAVDGISFYVDPFPFRRSIELSNLM